LTSFQLLYSYCEKLIDGGVSDFAWKTLSNLKLKDERLLALRHDLFQICGGEERTMAKEPEKPHRDHIQAINNALYPSRSQQRNPVFSPASTASVSSPSAFSLIGQHRQPYNAMQSMQPRPAFPSQTYSSYAPTPPLPPPIPGYQQSPAVGYVPTPPPPIPGPPPVPSFQPFTPASMYNSQPPAVPGFNPIQAPIPPPPVVPASFSNVPNANYNYASNIPQAGYAPSPSTVPAQEFSSKSSTVSPTGGSGGDNESSTHGWNDPPPLTARTTPAAAPIFEVRCVGSRRGSWQHSEVSLSHENHAMLFSRGIK
ncbi:hypothetical protein COOONC_17819, partial [Cooperia oncophora]